MKTTHCDKSRAWKCLLLTLAATLLLLNLGHARADSLDNDIRALMQGQHIPGLSVAIVKNGAVVRAQGYGYANLEWSAPAAPDTVYAMHSVSKQFAAASIMLLKEQGKLSLDDPVSKYFEGTPDAWKTMTVRHLLSHTSGVPDYLDIDLHLPDTASHEDEVKALGKLPLLFPPGTKFSYSNSGYMMLGVIIRKVSGQNSTDYIREHIWKPLGMLSTRANSIQDIIPHRASKYVWKDDRWLNAEPPYNPDQVADSGMMSTVLDMAKWDAALYTDRILSAASRREMWTRTPLNGGTTAPYGLGFFVTDTHGHRTVWHYGASFNGNRTMICRFPDDGFTVIILTNGGTPHFNPFLNRIAKDFAPGLLPIDLSEL